VQSRGKRSRYAGLAGRFGHVRFAMSGQVGSDDHPLCGKRLYIADPVNPGTLPAMAKDDRLALAPYAPDHDAIAAGRFDPASTRVERGDFRRHIFVLDESRLAHA
jgi:hypothetical protein